MTGERHHAADDGSLARSTGGAAARGAMLIALAVIIGLVLLAFALDDPADVIASDDAASQSDDSADDSGDGTSSDDSSGDSDDGSTADGDTGTTTIPTITTTTGVVSSTNPPAEVAVLIANGTGQKGIAGAVSDKVAAKGFLTLEPANAPSTELSVIYYRPGYDGDAREIATIVGAPADVITNWPETGTVGVAANATDDGRLDSANLVVIVGSDGRIPTG